LAAQLEQTVCNRIAILVEDIWRFARLTGSPTASGEIEAELNGQIILLTKGYWFNIHDYQSEELAEQLVAERNISRICKKAMIRDIEKSALERDRKRQEAIDAARLAAVGDLVRITTEEEERRAFDQGDILDDSTYNIFGECDCDDCKRSRGET
jgi:hypothetical protein